MIYEAISNFTGDWRVGKIENHLAKPLTREECEEACRLLNSQMQPSNGGPAFPLQDWDECIHSKRFETGMTLRDYFAAKAMNGILASCPEGIRFQNLPDDSFGRWAESSYRMADAMLKARNE